MSPVLVTGARGFVGRHLLEQAAAAGVEAIALGGDLRDPAAAVAAIEHARPSAVIHLANPPRGEEEDAARMAHHVAAALRACASDAPLLVAGSAAQYGMGLDRALREDDPRAPLTPYAAAKDAIEASLLAEPGVRVIWARAFNHIGPGQGLDAPVANWARDIAACERTGGGTLRTGNLDVVRDFLDVRDVADAYLALVRSDAAGPVNVCSGRPVTLRGLVELLVEQARVPVELTIDPALFRAEDPPHVVGDPSRLRSLTGWEPRIPLAVSLRDVLDQWRAA